jgi:holin-like protein
MSSRTITLFARHQFHTNRLVQVMVLSLFWLAGECVVRALNLPLPGGVVGMALVLALLASGRLRPVSMRGGARWLLAEMLLFFVPAVLAVLNHQEFVGLLGLKILVVILGGTACVMCATALAVEFGYRFMLAHGGNNADLQ